MGAVIRNKITLGIDASNIRQGGGVTHLLELLSAFNSEKFSIAKIFLWGSRNTLNQIPDNPFVIKVYPRLLQGGVLRQILWQLFMLTREARSEECDLLFIPGGSYIGTFKPVVSMCQNLLPFELREIKRFWGSLTFYKLLILRVVQSWTFRHSQGVIFLSEYSKDKVLDVIGKIEGSTKVIPHGLSYKFSPPSTHNRSSATNLQRRPVKLLYVSNIAPYKHQDNVLEAVKSLVEKGYPLKLSFLGPGSKSEVIGFKKLLAKSDPDQRWSEYLGVVSYDEISNSYKEADIGIFASSCETFGFILLEKMASQLPIVCSNMSSMPELLKCGGIYFNPDNPNSIANAIEIYLLSPELCVNNARVACSLAKKYSWERTANETYNFLEKIACEYKGV